MTGQANLLEIRGVSKYFPGVQALDAVDFNLKKGEVHALIGENGAGKTTLMKILLGIHQPEEGEIRFLGETVNLKSPHKALNLGISMIHQEICLIPYRTVAENIWIGREPIKKTTKLLDWKQMYKSADELFEKLNMDIDSKSIVSKHSVANMQMIEIARAISYNSKIIIMDEPTSALTEQEANKLFDIIKSLKEKGISIIYITHKLSEIPNIADRVTVLRDGQFIGTRNISEITTKEMISMMVGRELTHIFPKKQVDIGDVVFEVKGLTRKGVFKDISFSVRKGEILGITGLMGAGRTEVARAIFGIDPIDSGEIILENKKINIKNAQDAINQGISMVTEDRKQYGLALCRPVKENVLLANYDRVVKNGLLQTKKENELCKKMVKMLAIKTAGLKQRVSALSGGNQQKVTLANWLLTEPKVLILDEPTRGIDVGAKSEIHKLMTQFVENGMAVIMISSEMPEMLGMSDRVIVLHEGELKGEFMREEATQEKFLECAIGNGKTQSVFNINGRNK